MNKLTLLAKKAVAALLVLALSFSILGGTIALATEQPNGDPAPTENSTEPAGEGETEEQPPKQEQEAQGEETNEEVIQAQGAVAPLAAVPSSWWVQAAGTATQDDTTNTLTVQAAASSDAIIATDMGAGGNVNNITFSAQIFKDTSNDTDIQIGLRTNGAWSSGIIIDFQKAENRCAVYRANGGFSAYVIGDTDTGLVNGWNDVKVKLIDGTISITVNGVALTGSVAADSYTGIIWFRKPANGGTLQIRNVEVSSLNGVPSKTKFFMNPSGVEAANANFVTNVDDAAISPFWYRGTSLTSHWQKMKSSNALKLAVLTDNAAVNANIGSPSSSFSNAPINVQDIYTQFDMRVPLGSDRVSIFLRSPYLDGGGAAQGIFFNSTNAVLIGTVNNFETFNLPSGIVPHELVTVKILLQGSNLKVWVNGTEIINKTNIPNSTDTNVSTFGFGSGKYFGEFQNFQAFVNGSTTLEKYFMSTEAPAADLAPLVAPSATYYIDSTIATGGNGLSPETALKTLADFNAKNLILNPGDKVLLKRGSEFTPGQRLIIHGKGTRDKWIEVDAYGPETANKPRIMGTGGANNIGVLVEDITSVSGKTHTPFEFIRISNLDIRKVRLGIYFRYVLNSTTSTNTGLQVLDCDFQDIQAPAIMDNINKAGNSTAIDAAISAQLQLAKGGLAYFDGTNYQATGGGVGEYIFPAAIFIGGKTGSYMSNDANTKPLVSEFTVKNVVIDNAAAGIMSTFYWPHGTQKGNDVFRRIIEKVRIDNVVATGVFNGAIAFDSVNGGSPASNAAPADTDKWGLITNLRILEGAFTATNTLWPHGETGVILNNSQNFFFQGNEFAYIQNANGYQNDGCAIDFETNCDNVTIRDSSIHNNQGHAVLMMDGGNFGGNNAISFLADLFYNNLQTKDINSAHDIMVNQSSQDKKQTLIRFNNSDFFSRYTTQTTAENPSVRYSGVAINRANGSNNTGFLAINNFLVGSPNAVIPNGNSRYLYVNQVSNLPAAAGTPPVPAVGSFYPNKSTHNLTAATTQLIGIGINSFLYNAINIKGTTAGAISGTYKIQHYGDANTPSSSTWAANTFTTGSFSNITDGYIPLDLGTKKGYPIRHFEITLDSGYQAGATVEFITDANVKATAVSAQANQVQVELNGDSFPMFKGDFDYSSVNSTDLNGNHSPLKAADFTVAANTVTSVTRVNYNTAILSLSSPWVANTEVQVKSSGLSKAIGDIVAKKEPYGATKIGGFYNDYLSNKMAQVPMQYYRETASNIDVNTGTQNDKTTPFFEQAGSKWGKIKSTGILKVDSFGTQPVYQAAVVAGIAADNGLLVNDIDAEFSFRVPDSTDPAARRTGFFVRSNDTAGGAGVAFLFNSANLVLIDNITTPGTQIISQPIPLPTNIDAHHFVKIKVLLDGSKMKMYLNDDSDPLYTTDTFPLKPTSNANSFFGFQSNDYYGAFKNFQAYVNKGFTRIELFKATGETITPLPDPTEGAVITGRPTADADNFFNQPGGNSTNNTWIITENNTLKDNAISATTAHAITSGMADGGLKHYDLYTQFDMALPVAGRSAGFVLRASAPAGGHNLNFMLNKDTLTIADEIGVDPNSWLPTDKNLFYVAGQNTKSTAIDIKALGIPEHGFITLHIFLAGSHLKVEAKKAGSTGAYTTLYETTKAPVTDITGNNFFSFITDKYRGEFKNLQLFVNNSTTLQKKFMAASETVADLVVPNDFDDLPVVAGVVIDEKTIPFFPQPGDYEPSIATANWVKTPSGSLKNNINDPTKTNPTATIVSGMWAGLNHADIAFEMDLRIPSVTRETGFYLRGTAPQNGKSGIRVGFNTRFVKVYGTYGASNTLYNKSVSFATPLPLDEFANIKVKLKGSDFTLSVNGVVKLTLTDFPPALATTNYFGLYADGYRAEYKNIMAYVNDGQVLQKHFMVDNVTPPEPPPLEEETTTITPKQEAGPVIVTTAAKSNIWEQGGEWVISPEGELKSNSKYGYSAVATDFGGWAQQPSFELASTMLVPTTTAVGEPDTTASIFFRASVANGSGSGTEVRFTGDEVQVYNNGKLVGDAAYPKPVGARIAPMSMQKNVEVEAAANSQFAIAPMSTTPTFTAAAVVLKVIGNTMRLFIDNVEFILTAANPLIVVPPSNGNLGGFITNNFRGSFSNISAGANLISPGFMMFPGIGEVYKVTPSTTGVFMPFSNASITQNTAKGERKVTDKDEFFPQVGGYSMDDAQKFWVITKSDSLKFTGVSEGRIATIATGFGMDPKKVADVDLSYDILVPKNGASESWAAAYLRASSPALGLDGIQVALFNDTLHIEYPTSGGIDRVSNEQRVVNKIFTVEPKHLKQGDFNNVRILLKGSSMAVYLNGRLTATVSGISSKAGFSGFSAYEHQVEIKNLVCYVNDGFVAFEKLFNDAVWEKSVSAGAIVYGDKLKDEDGFFPQPGGYDAKEMVAGWVKTANGELKTNLLKGGKIATATTGYGLAPDKVKDIELHTSLLVPQTGGRDRWSALYFRGEAPQNGLSGIMVYFQDNKVGFYDAITDPEKPTFKTYNAPALKPGEYNDIVVKLEDKTLLVTANEKEILKLDNVPKGEGYSGVSANNFRVSIKNILAKTNGFSKYYTTYLEKDFKVPDWAASSLATSPLPSISAEIEETKPNDIAPQTITDIIKSNLPLYIALLTVLTLIIIGAVTYLIILKGKPTKKPTGAAK